MYAIRAQREPLAFAGVTLLTLFLGGAVLVDDFSVPLAVVVLGVIVGLTYGLLAVGLVLVHRTSGVLNFAHAEVGTLAASFFGIWVVGGNLGGLGIPYWLMFPVAMAVGAAANMSVEVIAVRRLRKVPRVMSLVMTLGAAEFFLLVSSAVNTKIRNGALYPRPPWFPAFTVGTLRVTPEYTAMLVLTPLVVVALALFLSRTRFGVALRASAENRDAALLDAIPANRMSSVAWGLAGAASALVAVLQFPEKGFMIGGASLGPALLVRALLPAIVARLRSLPVALAFGVVVGIIDQVGRFNTDGSGPTEVILFVILLVVLVLQSRDSGRARRAEDWATARPWPALPAAWRRIPAVRAVTPASMGLATALFLAVALSSNQAAFAFTLVVAFTIVGLSIYVITGMGGELSLGQFAVAAVGAVVSVHFVNEVFRSFPVGFLVGGLAGSLVCVLIGIPALRIRGLMLGVTTLSFAVAIQAWVMPQPWAVGLGLDPAQLVFIDERVPTARGYFVFTLPFLAGALWLVRNLNRGGYARALRGLRDNEDGARAFAVPSTRRKLEAFAFAGFLAGLGGAVYAHALPRLNPDTFAASRSITAVAIALIGGLAIMVGPLLGALYLTALPALVDLDAVGLAVSTFGWMILLLYFPGGLAQAVKPLRDRLLGRLAGPVPLEAPAPETDAVTQISSAAAGIPARAQVAPRAVATDIVPLLETKALSKSFGGIHAVDQVSITVRAGQTVGIIGANGAGKTTLFELIGGFTPADAGTVLFGGVDVTKAAPEQRAALGLVRSFQDARLFPTLTVRETLRLACERIAPTGLLSTLTSWPSAVEAEERKALRADELIDTMGLGAYADKAVGELSTGTRRIADLASIIALRPRLVLLDEPSSGVAQRETEALGGLLSRLKSMLDTTFVVIEHDMPLLLGISDEIVAMETGRVIAAGEPQAVIQDPAVVASYLGTDRRAVERSGAVLEERPSASNGGPTPRPKRTRVAAVPRSET